MNILDYQVFGNILQFRSAEYVFSQPIDLFGKDIGQNGGMHEYYVPETGKGVMNLGFMNWDYLVANMIRDCPR